VAAAAPDVNAVPKAKGAPAKAASAKAKPAAKKASKPAAKPPKAAAKPAKAPAKPAKAEAKPAKAPKADAKAAKTADASEGGSKPRGLKAPRKSGADDLKQIEGIGPALEKLCNDMGVWHFDQIAKWGPNEVAWMDGNLKGFRGRVTRDKWVAQAKIIVDEGLERFLERAKTNDY
jgi:NADH-quinone oxidoreductase subunit E